MSTRDRLFVTLAALVVSACASSHAEKSPSTTTTTPTPLPPEKPWVILSLAERKAHMNAHVMPVMEAHFTRHDAQRYADFSCETCHGADMVARGFKMPNPSLLALPATGSEEQHKMVATYPEMVKLMFNHVLPDVQTLLGASPYDKSTKTGFSCYGCHPAASAAPQATL